MKGKSKAQLVQLIAVDSKPSRNPKACPNLLGIPYFQFTLPAEGQSEGALLGMTAGASSFSLLYSAILSTALKAFSATLASRTVMEVREVICRA